MVFGDSGPPRQRIAAADKAPVKARDPRRKSRLP